MGSCISKCNPQKDFQEEDNHLDNHECVRDKLVISQAPISPKISLPSSSSTIQKRVSSSPSSSSSSVSLSSFSSIVTNTTLSSSLSSSSSSSSSSCFKDRSFSNDFLLSCAQEHDHILDIKKINKGTTCVTQSMSSTMLRSSSSSSSLSKPPSPRRECNSTTPKKRPRANSPTIVRQKSFRKEPDQQLKGGNIGNNTLNATSTYHHFPNRTTLKSPSPSRRFPSNLNGDSSFRRSVVSKGNNGNILSRSSSLRRENHINNNQPAITPKREGKMRNALQVSPKIDEMEIGEVKSSHDLDSFLMEDINNPLIALDCFIFL
ncbi:uncharacterized protein LOC107770514 [Nicotiana tabacum]|uniref:Uncharacterized protein LOC107770514 n=1 Tax=Nicotiana tabacum TaxID=4097 RepID=A0A1S3XZI7_TOBAC|nr:putative protein TPRXL [Nicotiana tomentosiformis]XP_016445320.1 PREDICTED: putative protein TPRXL [Nicotiana tabacum]